MATATLTASLVGQAGDTFIYRIDLSQSGFGAIKSITIADDNVVSGGTGGVSGIDLDFVKLSSSAATSASSVSSLPGENAFNFGSNGIIFNRGFLQPWSRGENPIWNKPYLSGTDANIYNPEKATLDHRDGKSAADTGSVSLGEGGTFTFLLNHAVSTDGKYLYIGERGGGDEGFSVTVSTDSGGPISTPSASGIRLTGTSGNDRIMLGQGINGHLGAGNDFIDGRGGHDWLGGARGNDTIYGGSGNDCVYGGFGDDQLYAGLGKDKLYGGPGNDLMYGGPGNDVMYGGTGRDTFVCNARLGNASSDRKFNFDTIRDFNVRYDSLWLDNAVFKKLGSGSVSNPKPLNKEFFVTSSTARERDDYLIYNKKTGVLSYDADGSGSKQAVEFAHLSKNLKLTNNDFFVI
jgi:Ca2+-binding RTX toxin-like protein